jgi:uncharacterized cupredoxin-like copper-binding protein
MGRFGRTAFWSALACVVALLALILWWNSGSEKETRESSATGESSVIGRQEAVGSGSPRESRRSLGGWLGSWGFFTGGQESQSPGWETREVEDAVRGTFLAHNSQDLQTFKDGWTDKGFQRAYERPKEKITDFGLLSLLSFRPYTIGEFSNTAVNGKSATTEVALTYGEVQESHRMSLLREDGAWKIDQDEKLALIPKDATVVDVKLKFYIIELDRTRAAPGTVAFRITNADTRQHEFIVKRWNPDSDTEETIGKIKPLSPGQNETLVLANLEPGRYIILCNMVGRDAMPLSYGMRNEFIIQ